MKLPDADLARDYYNEIVDEADNDHRHYHQSCRKQRLIGRMWNGHPAQLSDISLSKTVIPAILLIAEQTRTVFGEVDENGLDGR